MKKFICVFLCVFISCTVLCSCSLLNGDTDAVFNTQTFLTESEKTEINTPAIDSESINVLTTSVDIKNSTTTMSTSSSTTTSTSVDVNTLPDEPKNVELSVYELYKEYFYINYNGNEDRVYLCDVTHDGVDDMLVFDIVDEGSYERRGSGTLKIYTVINNSVKNIYSDAIHNRVRFYLTNYEGMSNIVCSSNNVWTGLGAVVVTEFYVSNNGVKEKVNEIQQRYGNGNNTLFSYEESVAADLELESHIADRYGESFNNIYLLWYGDFDDQAELNSIPNKIF